MPRVSATIRSCTRSSSRPRLTESSSARASPLIRPPTVRSGSPSNTRSVARVTDGEHQRDRFGQQPPRHESENLRRHLVQPLRVVDQADERPLLGNGRQQAQHRQADQKAIGCLAGDQAERRAEGVSLRTRQVLRRGPTSGRTTGARLRRRSSISDSTPAARTTRHPELVVREVVHQGGLADACLTAKDQHPALMAARRRPAADPTPRTRCADRAGRNAGSRLNPPTPTNRPADKELPGNDSSGYSPERCSNLNERSFWGAIERPLLVTGSRGAPRLLFERSGGSSPSQRPSTGSSQSSKRVAPSWAPSPGTSVRSPSSAPK